ncbi:hypothetical protein JKP88DRAFT_248312 [Tribonema minus]|uniref:Uncharacterized protein n=1 Tax=Tribonema minus TaxID=303371 RepID=A0A835YPF1_9STRA|nr:hypothetical protein JKP88DRAFT_248312 [Tribonema minus]
MRFIRLIALACVTGACASASLSSAYGSASSDSNDYNSTTVYSEGADNVNLGGRLYDLERLDVHATAHKSVKRTTYVGARFPGDETPFLMQQKWDVQFSVITVYRPIESVGYNYIRTDGKKLQLVKPNCITSGSRGTVIPTHL